MTIYKIDKQRSTVYHWELYLILCKKNLKMNIYIYVCVCVYIYIYIYIYIYTVLSHFSCDSLQSY